MWLYDLLPLRRNSLAVNSTAHHIILNDDQRFSRGCQKVPSPSPRYGHTISDNLRNIFPLSNMWVQQGGVQYIISSNFFSLRCYWSGSRNQACTWIRSRPSSKILPGYGLTLCLRASYWNETISPLSQGTRPRDSVFRRWGYPLSYKSSVNWKAPLQLACPSYFRNSCLIAFLWVAS